MKYFLHDTNSFNDEKITMLFMNFGYEGLGLFYTILEKLAQQEKPIKTEVLKAQLRVGKKLEKCWKFMESLEIISSTNGETFNMKLLKFSEKYEIKKENTRIRVEQFRRNQAKNTDCNTLQECYSVTSNNPKVKESKVKESKVQVQNNDFDLFWSKYPNKKAKGGAIKAFERIEVDVGVLINALDAQITERKKKTELGLFVPDWKHPATWLNQKCWEDEIKTNEELEGIIKNGNTKNNNTNTTVARANYTIRDADENVRKTVESIEARRRARCECS